MKVVLDTSAVIHLVERKHPALVAELRHATEPPLISAVTLGELAIGWSTLPADSPRRRTYRAAQRLRVVDIVGDTLHPEPDGVIASFGACRAAGIKGNDAWIAATARAWAATLITFDTKLAERFTAVGVSMLLDP
jgi:predicted nucleic acid-binding protein